MKAFFRWLGGLFGGRPKASAPRPDVRHTVEVTDLTAASVVMAYAPRKNGVPDAGEVVWAWIPFAEDPSQGKDRPVLVIARDDNLHVFAVKLTSKRPTRGSDHLLIGSGAWDAQGRESWVDVEQLYRVHNYGIRREAAVLDRDVYRRVTTELERRHGWSVQG